MLISLQNPFFWTWKQLFLLATSNICPLAIPEFFAHNMGIRLLANHSLLLPADLCLTGLQISTNQRATRKCIWGSIHSRAFHEGKFTVLRNSGILFLTVQRLSTFAYDTHGQVKDMRLLKSNVLFVLR